MRLAILAVAVLALGTGVVPATAQRPALAMLDGIEAGRWELRLRDAGGGIERMCVHDGRSLIQLRHPQQNCERFVVSDMPNAVIVQYTCNGRGYGRTQIRKESGRLVHIESQGIAGGLPFNFVAEGRRVGECG